ncbi:hypothetical protein CRENBAI_020926 [Crenichthys baileyi]|uniref:Uncharacterized protein n=1 Tax=Crenichthys baileyi TaxID=28760 RepID=A0AAV9RXF9_9TELE
MGHLALHNRAPCYVTNLPHRHTPACSLCSSDANLLSPPLRTKHRTWGYRVFSTAAPTLWNSLSKQVRDSRRDYQNPSEKSRGESQGNNSAANAEPPGSFNNKPTVPAGSHLRPSRSSHGPRDSRHQNILLPKQRHNRAQGSRPQQVATGYTAKHTAAETENHKDTSGQNTYHQQVQVLIPHRDNQPQEVVLFPPGVEIGRPPQHLNLVRASPGSCLNLSDPGPDPDPTPRPQSPLTPIRRDGKARTPRNATPAPTHRCNRADTIDHRAHNRTPDLTPRWVKLTRQEVPSHQQALGAGVPHYAPATTQTHHITGTAAIAQVETLSSSALPSALS